VGVRKEKAAETRTALKDAARKLFVERGYLNTKITDIAAGAGRATGSFYEHFDSKQALLQALLDDMHQHAREQMTAHQHPHPREHDLTDRAQLRAHLAVAWYLMKDNLPAVVALYESAMTDGHSPDQAWEMLTRDTSVLREHLEWLADQGRPLPGDPTLVAAAMGGMLSSLAYAILRTDNSGLTDDQVLDTLTALLGDGLRGA
jgi:AcrR family transcriptional regulator